MCGTVRVAGCLQQFADLLSHGLIWDIAVINQVEEFGTILAQSPLVAPNAYWLIFSSRNYTVHVACCHDLNLQRLLIPKNIVLLHPLHNTVYISIYLLPPQYVVIILSAYLFRRQYSQLYICIYYPTILSIYSPTFSFCFMPELLSNF